MIRVAEQVLFSRLLASQALETPEVGAKLKKSRLRSTCHRVPVIQVVVKQHGKVELYLLHSTPLYQLQLVRTEQQQQVHQDVLFLVLKMYF